MSIYVNTINYILYVPKVLDKMNNMVTLIRRNISQYSFVVSTFFSSYANNDILKEELRIPEQI